jgi:prepilin-type N-terminal cleavage/methylation domain-containing protein
VGRFFPIPCRQRSGARNHKASSGPAVDCRRAAFTLTELVTAVAILALVLSFAGIIFKVSINANRLASANAENMRKLRAITDMLNADFRGIRDDAPMLVLFERDPNQPGRRFDRIMFFADGDFQSAQMYDDAGPNESGDRFLTGNAARIYYGQAATAAAADPVNVPPAGGLLCRRQHILSAEPGLDRWPDANDIAESFTALAANNETYEHDSMTLSQWKAVDANDFRQITAACLDSHPMVDPSDSDTIHRLMCEGMGSFSVQWAYWDDPGGGTEDRLVWFPDEDPDGDGDTADSHFDINGSDTIGAFFNLPGLIAFGDWGDAARPEYRGGVNFPQSFYPKALKFTFRLYDSKGVLEDGRQFTHIVYLER